MFGLFARDRVRENLRHFCAETGGAREEDYGRAGGRSRELHGAGGEQHGAWRESSGTSTWERKKEKWLLGGGRAPGDGYFIQPTIIADVAPKARMAQEEIFGPVLAVIKAKDFDEALEIANDTEFGLTGAVYSQNAEKIEKAQEAFHVGNLYLNRKCTGAMVGAHPFGGFNMSGTDSKTGGKGLFAAFPAGEIDCRESFELSS